MIGICEGIRVELIVRGEVVGFGNDELLRNHLPRMFSLIKNESSGIEDLDLFSVARNGNGNLQRKTIGKCVRQHKRGILGTVGHCEEFRPSFGSSF